MGDFFKFRKCKAILYYTISQFNTCLLFSVILETKPCVSCVIVDLWLSSFLREGVEQTCLLASCLFEGPGGLLGLGSVHTCLAFSVVDAVKLYGFLKTISCFYLVLEIQYTFLIQSNCGLVKKFFPLKLLWGLLFLASSNLPVVLTHCYKDRSWNSDLERGGKWSSPKDVSCSCHLPTVAALRD